MDLVLTEFAYDVLGGSQEGPEPTPDGASAFMSELMTFDFIFRVTAKGQQLIFRAGRTLAR